VSRLVRAFDPRPGAYAVRSAGEASQEVKLFGARVAPRTSDRLPGEVLAIDDQGMTVACGAAGDGSVQIASVQPAGKRAMSPREWASGRGIAVGERLS
jgi:methionyl-tRNA formyltransferase